MEYQNIINLLGTISDNVPRFITKKWIEVHDQSGTAEDRYKPGKQIRYKTSMLRSDLCDYSDAYIVVKGKITATNPTAAAYDKRLAFKNNALFSSCNSQINNTLIDNAENLDIVMPMYNLIEYRKNYRRITGSLWNYYRDEPNSGFDGEGSNRINYSIKKSKCFFYKTGITGRLTGIGTIDITKDAEIVVPLKHLSNFWKILGIPLVDCEVSLVLTGSENCIITSKATREVDPDADPAVAGINNSTNTTFEIKDTKLYVPLVTLSAENDNKLLEQLKKGFKRTIKWKKMYNV